jgi:DNA-binding transcriptional LysR family regulator
MSVKTKTTLIRDLLYLREIIIYGGISTAATKNGIKSSNLSAYIKHLEDRLGTPLLNRHSYGITPTPYAESIIGQLTQIENTVALIDRAGQRETPTRLNVCCPDNIVVNGLDEFERQSHISVRFCPIERQSDVVVSYKPPENRPHMTVIENTIGTGFKQKIWVSCVKKDDADLVARFIISQIHLS